MPCAVEHIIDLDEPFTGPYYTVDDKNICGKCFDESRPTCLQCKQKIDNEYLLAFDATYHKECFLCNECNAVIGRKCVLSQRTHTFRGMDG